MTETQAKTIGFIPQGENSDYFLYELSKNRYLYLYKPATPRETLYIMEKSGDVFTDQICLHHKGSDGNLRARRVRNLIKILENKDEEI